MSKDSQSTNFKKSPASWRNTQSQVQQNGHSSIPGMPPFNEQYQIGHRDTEELPVYPSNGIQPLRAPAPRRMYMPDTPTSSVPLIPFPIAPETPGAWAKPAIVDPRRQQQVKYYADWLAKQAKYDVLHDNSQEINDYIQEATKIVKVGDKEVAMFAPFRAKLSALQTFTTRQVVALCVIGLLWIIGLLVFRLEMLTVVIAAITVLYTFNLILSASMALRTFQNSPEERISDAIVFALKNVDWPFYTILCPLYREAQVVPQFVQAMLALDYPPEKLQILFLTEENDAETRNAIRALSLPPHFELVAVPDGKPRTKPRACNYGLMLATGSYVVIYDAEDIPDRLQLKKAVLTFANHETDVVCVQAKLNFYNIRQNLLTRWFTAEYSAWFDVILPGLQLAKFSLPLGGTSNHFRTAALRALGGWDAYNVTEDCDLGLRLKRYGMNTVILDSTTLEEANSQVKNWIRQRSRWIKGYMQTYLVHMRHPLEDFQKGRLYDLFSFQVLIGSGTGVMFLNPLMWVLLGIYIVFGPSVVNIYHVLFPGPILYLSAFCLIFGNLFYVYLYLLACAKRKQYHLLPWTLFIPFYWLLMSVAALYALFELLVKPHYWQKTVHGLHLKGKHASPVVPSLLGIPTVAEEPTMPVPVTLGKGSKVGTIPSVKDSLKAMPTLLMPAISRRQKQAQGVAKRVKVRDLWLVATIVIACVTSIAACWYYFQQDKILLYADAHSHMRLARSVFDGLTPGLAQLGGVWLPLPHILMWPFIWNDYLWHTGLAGSFVSMPCYVIAAIYLYLSARRLTGNCPISFVGALAFLLNPNVLYLQTTPLSELVCVAAFTIAGYYFLSWVQEDKTHQLVLAAASTLLATLARYDGWPIFLALLTLIIAIGWLKGHRWRQIQGNVILFGILGGIGIALWFAWCGIILGDPLYFQRGQFSSQSQQIAFLQKGYLYGYHNLWQSVRLYFTVSMKTIGYLLFALAAFAALAVIVYVFYHLLTFRKNKNHARMESMLVALTFLIPFAFYVVSLYSGQAIIWVPGAVPANAPNQFFNVRYGVETVAPIALFLAILADGVVRRLKVRTAVLCLILLAVIIAQSIYVGSTGIISLEDGISGRDCLPTSSIDFYLAQHYNGGRILVDTFNSNFNEAETGIDFKNIIYDGSGAYWDQGLRDPAAVVDWVIADPGDLVSTHLDTKSPAFLQNFTLVASSGINFLYHKRGLPPLPTRTLPPGFLSEHRFCTGK